MNSFKIKNIPHHLIIMNATLFSYMGYLTLLTMNDDIVTSSTIYWLSVCGYFVGFLVIYSYYKITGKIFTLYSIFMLFFFLFNYGQPLMWAIGIHRSNEIGKVGLYTLGRPAIKEIALSQGLILSSIIMFHFGSIITYNAKRKSRKKEKSTNRTVDHFLLYDTARKLSYIVFPITLYNLIYKVYITATYGYSSYYYGDGIVNNIVLFNLIEHMFFPTLIGLLIGGGMNKKNVYNVFFIFFIYSFISILSGDRGNWIPPLLVLIWVYHRYYRSIKIFDFLKTAILGLFGMTVLNAIVSVRNIGITLNNIITALINNDSAIVNTIFEMGGSMRPTVVLFKQGWDIWPYKNTYVNALLGMFSSRVLTFLNIPWEPLSDWFSQSYLKIPYGAAFSIVAESLINYGPKIAPLFLLFLGTIIMKLTFVDESKKRIDSPIPLWFSISTMIFALGVIRNHFLWVTKSWFYGVILIYIIIKIRKKHIENTKQRIGDNDDKTY